MPIPNIDPDKLKKSEKEFKDIVLASVKSYHKSCIGEEKNGVKPTHSSSQVFNVLLTLQMFEKIDLGGVFNSSMTNMRENHGNK